MTKRIMSLHHIRQQAQKIKRGLAAELKYLEQAKTKREALEIAIAMPTDITVSLVTNHETLKEIE